jgi:hypothetical protein
MIQMQTAAEKAKKRDEPLDTTKMQTVRADVPATTTPAPAPAKPAAIPAVSNVVS